LPKAAIASGGARVEGPSSTQRERVAGSSAGSPRPDEVPLARRATSKDDLVVALDPGRSLPLGELCRLMLVAGDKPGHLAQEVGSGG
jgi:hypothetical protein